MAHWPWSSVQSSQEDRVPERYSPGLGVQEAQVDRTQTLRRPNSFETNPQFSFKFKAQSFKIPGLTASYSRVHPSFYLPCSYSSGLSSLPCLCPIVEEASLKPSNFSCGSRAPWEPRKSLFRPSRAVICSLWQVAVLKPLFNLFHHQTAINYLYDVGVLTQLLFTVKILNSSKSSMSLSPVPS